MFQENHDDKHSNVSLINKYLFSDTSFPPKPKLRKVERKLVPVLEKLSVEELMETNTYQRFNRSIEIIFENTEDMDLTADFGNVVKNKYHLPNVVMFCSIDVHNIENMNIITNLM